MKRDEALRLLRQHEADLRRLGVAHASLFGLTARDEATADSDVDVFITPAMRPFSLVNIVRVKRYISSTLGCAVDVFTHGGLSGALPAVRERIAAEMVDAF